jgi:hypothetical protein
VNAPSAAAAITRVRLWPTCRCEDAGSDDKALARDDGEEPADCGQSGQGDQAPWRVQCAFDERDDRVGHGVSSLEPVAFDCMRRAEVDRGASTIRTTVWPRSPGLRWTGAVLAAVVMGVRLSVGSNGMAPMSCGHVPVAPVALPGSTPGREPRGPVPSRRARRPRGRPAAPRRARCPTRWQPGAHTRVFPGRDAEARRAALTAHPTKPVRF